MLQRLKDNWLILLILLVGFVLRFYRIWDVPYTHDELSALNRSLVGSWPEFIAAVRADSHPAGVQLLIVLITKVFGFSPFAVKLPFALAGVGSIWMTYLIGKRLVSVESALIAAALLATTQYAITFSQWARPYSLGMFSALLFLWALLKLNHAERGVWRNVFFVGLFASMSAYVHYFALLQAAIVGLLFIPLMTTDRRKYYGGALLIAVLLSLPHLNIGLLHLSRGGIGEWLDPPKSDYWLDLLDYTFHFSILLPLLLTLLAVPYLLLNAKHWFKDYTWVFLFVSTCLPFAIAYYYSIFVNPLLHQSVVIFSLPFLFLFIGYFVRYSARLTQGIIVLIICINVAQLVSSRDHYDLNYENEYQSSLEWLDELEHQEAGIANLVDLREDFVRLIFDKRIERQSNIQLLEPIADANSLQEFLDNSKAKKFFFAMTAATAPEVFGAVLDHFPCIEEARYFHSGEAYLLSKNCDSRDSIAPHEVFDEMIFPNNPYSDGWEWKWDELDQETNTHFVLEYIGLSKNAMTVVEVNSQVQPFWSGVSLDKFRSPGKLKQKAYNVFYNSEFEWSSSAVLKSYVWLNGKGGFQLLEYMAYSVPKNPNKYRLLRE